VADFVEICNVCARKAIIEAAKRIINSEKVCHIYSDLNFGVTFFGTQCITGYHVSDEPPPKRTKHDVHSATLSFNKLHR